MGGGRASCALFVNYLKTPRRKRREKEENDARRTTHDAVAGDYRRPAPLHQSTAWLLVHTAVEAWMPLFFWFMVVLLQSESVLS